MSTRKFTPDEVALVHRTFMDGASKDDVALFIATCERTGLDPFARQIMPSSRNTNKNGQWITLWTWLVTIDGLRKIAVDSGDYEGQEGPWWCGKDGVWHEVWAQPGPCFAAKVLVHRKGFRVGLSGIAKYESYVQKKKDGLPNNVWATLGDHMTAKCAEALALRRAYPNEMAGLYTSDEMAQAGIEPIEPAKAAPVEYKWTEDELSEAKACVNEFGDVLMASRLLGEQEVKDILAKPDSTIGDPSLSYDKWVTKFLGYRDRTSAKHLVAPCDESTN